MSTAQAEKEAAAQAAIDAILAPEPRWMEGSEIDTVFSQNHEVTQSIQNRIVQLRGSFDPVAWQTLYRSLHADAMGVNAGLRAMLQKVNQMASAAYQRSREAPPWSAA